MAEVEEWLSSKSETITLTQAEAENFANCLIRITKVPFIYYVSKIWGVLDPLPSYVSIFYTPV